MSNDIAYFAVKSIGLSKIYGRKPCSLNDAARHNLREIQSELGSIGNINVKQTPNNLVIEGSNRSEGIVSLAYEIAANAGMDLSQRRYDYCQAIELIFSLPNNSAIEPHNYFQKCLQWVKSAYLLPVLSAVIHMDESAPHCHILLMPLGHDGVYVGSKPIGKLETKKQIESFYSHVALPFGLKRQGAKMRGAIKQAAIDLILERCKIAGLEVANGVLWPIFEASIKKDPVPALEALNIDRQEISEAYKKQITQETKPLGIEFSQLKPIEIDQIDSNEQTLSSVEFVDPQTSTQPQGGYELTKLKVNRLKQTNTGSEFYGDCMQTHNVDTFSIESEVCVIRVQDEYVHDLSAWDD